MSTMKQYIIWEAISHAWTEIGLHDDEIEKYAKKIKENYHNWEQVSVIIRRDICFSFSFESFLIFPCMLWMLMPDWGYDAKYLQRRALSWYSKPYWKHALNPLRVLGYPIAVVLVLNLSRKLKYAYENT